MRVALVLTAGLALMVSVTESKRCSWMGEPATAAASGGFFRRPRISARLGMRIRVGVDRFVDLLVVWAAPWVSGSSAAREWTLKVSLASLE